MNLKIGEKTITFKIIPLNIEKKDISNIFYRKKNKTLIETIKSPRYNFLNQFFNNERYKNYLNYNIGCFLNFLKDNNDNSYLCFLNKYGDNKFCNFRINCNLKDKGIYCFVHNKKIKYIGRCTNNFEKRINKGYGKIDPKNCFIDGQTTNCRLNTLINASVCIKFGVYVMNEDNIETIKELEKEILKCYKSDLCWNIKS